MIGARQPSSLTAKRTSVTLGNANNGQPCSINVSDYHASKLKNAESREKNTLGDQIKKANFEYGSSHLASGTPYATISKSNHGDKGNPMKQRATLDAEKANDLRCNHFTIGGPTANIS